MNSVGMRYRLGRPDDLPEICGIIEAAKRQMSRQGIEQWDDKYPVPADFEDDISKGNLYLALKDGAIAAVYVLSQECDEEYHDCQWENERPCILHRLCVSPALQNSGVGNEVLKHIETQLVESGYDSVRLDVFSRNPYALRLYEKNGYVRRGHADWRKGRFFLMEKKLDRAE